ncbi:hypothetical protein [Pseudonocardia sp. MH-G8]|uniref:DUF7701 domain-containing protein n=1 Tax=Pseudonocardia sp. MH-G8 TaxID=1854588 RepID=UPI000BA177D8|nr:hypothetical protein [Pseudonocardia sp. MH-G8]OZM79918.1 hypothetical protein CFP66_23225 [Pseudonocardia sp. MH-G8]
MTYIQHALKVLNRACPGLAPELAQLYALLALTRGSRTTLQDVHDAWAVWRNTTRPNHPSLVPFDQLSQDVQELDRKYMQAIHRTAREVTR